MEWVFETLGIDPQADVKTIRKAYARALRQCDQATEAERFQRIRQAYEWALRRAEHAQRAAAVPQASFASEEEQELPQASRPVPVRVALADDAQELASQVFAEFVEATRAPGPVAMGTLLANHSQDVRLTSLDAKMMFEQAVLVRAFAAPPDMDMLDEASDLFAWETSNRHLAAMRPDLVHRLQRQQMLRRFLDHGDGADRRQFVEAVQLYNLCQRDPHEKVMPWQVADANRLLDRYAAFRPELAERFGGAALQWWQERLRENATLLRAYEERQQAPVSPAQYRPRQRRTGGGSSFNWLFLLPVFAVARLIGGGFSSSHDQQQPSYVMPQVQIPQEPMQVPRIEYDEAFMRQMAEQGDPEVQNRLGEKIKLKATDSQGYREAFEWFQKAAGRGNPQAQYNLGLMYEAGQGVEQNPEKALELIRQAASNGHAEAQFHLGSMYKDGRIVEVDAQQARRWWEKAAAQHHLPAQYQLGLLYTRGEGVEQSYEAAARLWATTALSGNADAQNALGSLYERGLGVAQDYALAFRWYRNAAAQGHVAALESLASMFERGVTVAKNSVIADALMRVAASRKGPIQLNTTTAMASLDRQLSDDQRYQARLLAGELAGWAGNSSGSNRGFIAALDRAASGRIVAY